MLDYLSIPHFRQPANGQPSIRRPNRLKAAPKPAHEQDPELYSGEIVSGRPLMMKEGYLPVENERNQAKAVCPSMSRK